jgi:hypothetical protein
VAVHEQSRVVETVNVPDAPAAGADSIELDAVTWHFRLDGPSTLTDVDPHAEAMTTSSVHARQARASQAWRTQLTRKLE